MEIYYLVAVLQGTQLDNDQICQVRQGNRQQIYEFIARSAFDRGKVENVLNSFSFLRIPESG